ncbi:hypothetical protein KIPB_012722, partial [Kipferlia bialata]|eukprot:g12722.t1
MPAVDMSPLERERERENEMPNAAMQLFMDMYCERVWMIDHYAETGVDWARVQKFV